MLILPGKSASWAAGGFVPTDLGAKLTAWYDFTDPTVLFTDAARTPGNEVSTTGDFIRGVTDKSGNGYHLNNATAVNTWDAVNNQITMVGGTNNRYQLSPVIPNASQLTEAFAAIKTSDTQWQLFFDYWGYWMLRVDAGDSGSNDVISRGGTVADLYKDGVLVASDQTTPAALAALMDGSSVLFSIYPTTGLIGWGQGTQELFGNGYWSIDGTMTHIVFCEGLTSGERSDLETYLSTRKPV